MNDVVEPDSPVHSCCICDGQARFGCPFDEIKHAHNVGQVVVVAVTWWRKATRQTKNQWHSNSVGEASELGTAWHTNCELCCLAV